MVNGASSTTGGTAGGGTAIPFHERLYPATHKLDQSARACYIAGSHHPPYSVLHIAAGEVFERQRPQAARDCNGAIVRPFSASPLATNIPPPLGKQTADGSPSAEQDAVQKGMTGSASKGGQHSQRHQPGGFGDNSPQQVPTLSGVSDSPHTPSPTPSTPFLPQRPASAAPTGWGWRSVDSKPLTALSKEHARSPSAIPTQRTPNPAQRASPLKHLQGTDDTDDRETQPVARSKPPHPWFSPKQTHSAGSATAPLGVSRATGGAAHGSAGAAGTTGGHTSHGANQHHYNQLRPSSAAPGSGRLTPACAVLASICGPAAASATLINSSSGRYMAAGARPASAVPSQQATDRVTHPHTTVTLPVAANPTAVLNSGPIARAISDPAPAVDVIQHAMQASASATIRLTSASKQAQQPASGQGGQMMSQNKAGSSSSINTYPHHLVVGEEYDSVTVSSPVAALAPTTQYAQALTAAAATCHPLPDHLWGWGDAATQTSTPVRVSVPAMHHGRPPSPHQATEAARWLGKQRAVQQKERVGGTEYTEAPLSSIGSSTVTYQQGQGMPWLVSTDGHSIAHSRSASTGPFTNQPCQHYPAAALPWAVRSSTIAQPNSTPQSPAAAGKHLGSARCASAAGRYAGDLSTSARHGPGRNSSHSNVDISNSGASSGKLSPYLSSSSRASPALKPSSSTAAKQQKVSEKAPQSPLFASWPAEYSTSVGGVQSLSSKIRGSSGAFVVGQGPTGRANQPSMHRQGSSRGAAGGTTPAGGYVVHKGSVERA
jgi:hypothetical protein